MSMRANGRWRRRGAGVNPDAATAVLGLAVAIANAAIFIGQLLRAVT